MAKHVLCVPCGKPTKRCCTSPTCPIVVCVVHGRLRLTAVQRKALD